MQVRYKRDRFLFVSNLNQFTFDPNSKLGRARDAYLLSEHYSTPEKIALALQARRFRNTIISDNGNFSRMQVIAAKFMQRGHAILKEVKEQGLSPSLLAKRASLVEEIVQAVADQSESTDLEIVLEQQLQTSPHYLIGMEDLSIPVLQLCGLLQAEFATPVHEIAELQSNTIKLINKQLSGEICDYSSDKIVTFLVVHAFNYASARQGALQCSEESNAEAIAVSYGASMKSNQWVDKVYLGSKKISLNKKLPEKYITSQMLMRGVLDGLNEPKLMHVLGLGSPIMIVLTAIFASRCKAISIDSSAPYKDANAGVIYGSKHAFLKMKMYKLAAILLRNRESYRSDQPFWKHFDTKYPSDWEAMRSAMNLDDQGMTDLSVSDLAENIELRQDLVRKHIPYFTKLRSSDDPFYDELRFARAGSNYWVLRKICTAIRRRWGNQSSIQKWVEREVTRYRQTANPTWAEAVDAAYELSICALEDELQE